MNLPEAVPLESVSPSRFKDLTECQLRVAFGQRATMSEPQSDAQIIGDALHAVTADLVDHKLLGRGDMADLGEKRFWAELDKRAPGREVRRARATAARLRKLVARIGELLEEAGPDADSLTETYLEARGGAIRGIVDLIIESARLHIIIDYKTGQVMDDAGEVVDHFATQVRLYAVLEYERSGSWPSRGVLLRFGGPPIPVDVDPERCEETATRAVDALNAYNALAGSVPPGNPNERICRFCAFAPRCPAFWEAISPSWSPRGAVRGRVVWVESSAAGGLTVGLDNAVGSYTGGVVIRRLDDELFDGLSVGAEVSVCGLHADSDGRLVTDRGTRGAVTGFGEA